MSWLQVGPQTVATSESWSFTVTRSPTSWTCPLPPSKRVIASPLLAANARSIVALPARGETVRRESSACSLPASLRRPRAEARDQTVPLVLGENRLPGGCEAPASVVDIKVGYLLAPVS